MDTLTRIQQILLVLQNFKFNYSTDEDEELKDVFLRANLALLEGKTSEELVCNLQERAKAFVSRQTEPPAPYRHTRQKP